MDFKIKHYKQIDSTNLEAKRMAGIENGNLVIIADQQSAGYGRNAREWVTGDGNLAFSILLQDKLPQKAEFLSFFAATSIGDALNHEHIEYKWPNDIYLKGEKLAGILIEAGFDGEYIKYLIIGIGINILSAPNNISATSLIDHNIKIDRQEFLNNILVNFFAGYQNPELAFEKWSNRLYGVGKNVHLETKNATYQGICNGVDENGALIIDGKAISSGEVFFT